MNCRCDWAPPLWYLGMGPFGGCRLGKREDNIKERIIFFFLIRCPGTLALLTGMISLTLGGFGRN